VYDEGGGGIDDSNIDWSGRKEPERANERRETRRSVVGRLMTRETLTRRRQSSLPDSLQRRISHQHPSSSARAISASHDNDIRRNATATLLGAD